MLTCERVTKDRSASEDASLLKVSNNITDDYQWLVLPIQRPKVGAGPEIRPLQICRPKGAPGAGPVDLFLSHVVHIDRDAQHRGHGHKIGADVTKAKGTVVGPPVGHHSIHILEIPFPGQPWYEPGGWPGGIGTFAEGAMHFFRQVYSVTLSNLEGRSQSPDDVDPAHGNRHPPFRVKGG